MVSLVPKVSYKLPFLLDRLDYRDTAFYGRKWINRLVLQLAAMIEIVQAPPNSDPKVNRFAQGQKQVIEVTEELMLTFVQKEEIALAYRHTELDELVHKRATALVQELLSGYGDMDDANLKEMSWISPVLLSSCIRSKNEDVRLMVQKLVSRTSPATASSPYPAPVVPSLEANAKDETAIDSAIAAAESIES